MARRLRAVETSAPAAIYASRSGAYVGVVNLGAQLADRLLAFAQIVVIAAFFGAGRNADVYFLATIVPLLLASTIAEPFARSVVTELVRADRAQTAPIASAGLLGTVGVLSSLAVVYLAIALPLVYVLRPDGTRSLAPWIVFSLIGPAMGAGAYLSSLLLWTEQYVWAALRMPLSTGLGAAFLVPALELSTRLVWVAVALVGGYAVVSVALCIAAGNVLGRHWPIAITPQAWRTVRGLRRKLVAPVVGGAVSGQVIVLIERALAASVQPGAVALISYARGIAGAPTAISLALGATAYPRLARAEAAGSTAYLRDNFVRGLRVAVFTGVAFAVYFATFAHNLIGSLLQRGQFGSGDTHDTARLLAILAVSTFTGSAVFYLVNVLYGINAFAGILWLEGSIFLSYVVLALTLRRAFGLEGLALAFGLAQVVGCVVALILIGVKLGIGPRDVARSLAPIAPRLTLLAATLGFYKLAVDRAHISIAAHGLVYVGGATALLAILAPTLLLTAPLPEAAALRAAFVRLAGRLVR